MMMSYKVYSYLINSIQSTLCVGIAAVMDKEDMLITFEEHIRNLEKVTNYQHCVNYNIIHIESRGRKVEG